MKKESCLRTGGRKLRMKTDGKYQKNILRSQTGFAEREKLRLENIQFIYVAKGMIVLEQVQDMFASPE